MFKTFFMLVHGRVPVRCLDDRNALAVLEHQARTATRAIALARRELVAAIASDKAEARRLRELESRIAALEAHAEAALRAGRPEAAESAAGEIAALAAERIVGVQSRKVLATESQRRRDVIARAEMRLARCRRGRRLVAAEHAVRTLREGTVGRPFDGQALAEAEATLADLRRREIAALAAAGQAPGKAAPGKIPSGRLPTAFAAPAGRRLGPTAAEILAGLRNRVAMDRHPA